MRKTRALTIGSIAIIALLFSGVGNSSHSQDREEDDWISLFDGRTLEGWKASENPSTFSVDDGRIVADGPRAHLFYQGAVENHNFRNFEFRADVMTTPGSNSGIYFHTEYQETGWPSKGYEAQVNNTHSDPRKTGSLYAIDDIKRSPAEDNEWFTMHITVQGKRIVIRVDGEILVDYTEPENVERPEEMSGRVLSSGTFALQGHDPESRVYYRNIMVKPLPE
ncbi:MAG: DUF1080 domain-containing protein [Balneolaceae bacterium]|nr:DUF1080 domain-containing protein [Balneolaceae bacterium]